MALYVGSIKCPFCGREVSKEQRSVHLPQFVWNQADPLFPFGDATVHEECLKNDPLAPKVRVRYREFEEKTLHKTGYVSFAESRLPIPRITWVWDT
jgi:hypothetical protein